MQAIVQRTRIGEDGRVTVLVENAASGTIVEVIVLLPDAGDEEDDLLHAANSSMGFWDNPIDDEVWNSA